MNNQVEKKETTGSCLANNREMLVKDGKLTVVGGLVLVYAIMSVIEKFFNELNSN